MNNSRQLAELLKLPNLGARLPSCLQQAKCRSKGAPVLLDLVSTAPI
jgi:hypothetical protein